MRYVTTSSHYPNLIVLLISLGITTLPRSSILRTIPVAFIYKSPLFSFGTKVFCVNKGFLCKENGGRFFIMDICWLLLLYRIYFLVNSFASFLIVTDVAEYSGFEYLTSWEIESTDTPFISLIA